jgi:hypothetical protein
VDERPRQRHPLLQPCRELACCHVAAIIQAELREETIDPCRRRPRGQPMDRGVDLQVLAGREVLVERRILGQHTDGAADPLAVDHRIDPGDHDAPSVGPQQAVDDPQERRLAGSVVTEQPDDLTRLDAEAHPIDGRQRTEAARHLVEVDPAVDALPLVHPAIRTLLFRREAAGGADRPGGTVARPRAGHGRFVQPNRRSYRGLRHQNAARPDLTCPTDEWPLSAGRAWSASKRAGARPGPLPPARELARRGTGRPSWQPQ